MTESDEMEPLVCWCVQHDAVAVIYSDRSVTCMHQLIVESSAWDCRVVPLPRNRLARRSDIGSSEQASPVQTRERPA